LGGHREEILLLVFLVLGLVEGNVGEGVKTGSRSRGDRGTGDNICRAVRDIEEGIIFQVVKGGPDKFWRRRARRGSNRRGGVVGIGTRTWVVPGVEIGLEDLEC